jgi:D-alanyl-lipoteichoic acid acyltransferase DltB (MBOAT superfamily)
MASYGIVWHGMAWYGMVWHGMAWYGIVWHRMVSYGIVWYRMVSYFFSYRSFELNIYSNFKDYIPRKKTKNVPKVNPINFFKIVKTM